MSNEEYKGEFYEELEGNDEPKTEQEEQQKINLINPLLHIALNQRYGAVAMEAIQAYINQENRKLDAKFATAMASAQFEMEPIFADEESERTGKYASLRAIDVKVRKIYTKHGFAPTFTEEIDREDPDHVTMRMDLMHCSGCTKTYKMRLPADGKSLSGKTTMTRTHAAGSAFTYNQRYMLKLAFNLVTVDRDDDDGDAAGTTATINEEQLVELKKAMDAASADEGKFKTYFKIPSIEDLPHIRFKEAMEMLEMKRHDK